MAEATLPTDEGEFRAVVYESVLDSEQHLALVLGDVDGKDDVLVRVHSECLTGDVFGSLRCDCGTAARTRRSTGSPRRGPGVVVYLRGHEGRGIGLGHKIRAYALQEDGRDTVDANLELGFPAEIREYGIGAQILVDLGISTMRLMTNNPDKYGGLEGFGLDITERVALQSSPTEHNIEYLRTKRDRMGHLSEGLDGVVGLTPRSTPPSSTALAAPRRRDARGRPRGARAARRRRVLEVQRAITTRLLEGCLDELAALGVDART